MKRYFKYVHVVVFLILIFTVFDIRYNPFQTNSVVVEPAGIEMSSTKDDLYKEIEQKKRHTNKSRRMLTLIRFGRKHLEETVWK